QASGTVSGAGPRLQATVTANAKQLRLPAGMSVQALQLEGRAGMQADAPLALKVLAQQVVTPQATLDKLALDTTGTRTRHEAALHVDAQQRMLELRLRG